MAELDQDAELDDAELDDADEFDIDVLENEFFEQFMSPDDQQLSDPDADDDPEPVTEHSTMDAVRTVFEDRLTEAQLADLAEDLDLTSTSWVSIEEYRAAQGDLELADSFGDFDDAEDGEDD